jgi:hypothetical protein
MSRLKIYSMLALELMSVGAPANIIATVHNAGRIVLSLLQQKENTKPEGEIKVRISVDEIAFFLCDEICVKDVLRALRCEEKSTRGRKMLELACISWAVLRWCVSKSKKSLNEFRDRISESFRRQGIEKNSNLINWSSDFLLQQKSDSNKKDYKCSDILTCISTYKIGSPQRALVIPP